MKHRRKLRLIRPRLQLRLILVFLGMAALSLLLQFILFSASLSAMAERLPQDGAFLLESAGRVLLEVFVASFCLLLPMIFVIGVLTTHHFAGPVYRFETWLKQLIAGERPADCKLRKGDDLQDLCDLINEATRPLRQQPAATEPQRAAADSDAAPSLVERPASAPR